MLQKGLVPREPVKLVYPKCRCSRRDSSHGNQSSWSVPSVDAPKGPCPKGTSQVGLSQVSMLQKRLVPREPVKLVCPECRCSKRALSQGNQSSWSIPSVDAPEEPHPKGTSQVGLSPVSMLQKGLVPREPVKLVCPECRCSKRASSEENKSSWCVPSVGASKGPLCQGNQSSWSVPSVA